MVWCKQGIIVRSTDWIFCWNRPDWTQNVITVKTGVKSWLQRTQSEMNGVSTTYIYIFIHRIFYSLENRGKNFRKFKLKFVSSLHLPNFNQIDLFELIALFRHTVEDDNCSCFSADFKCAHFNGGSVGVNIKRTVCLGLVHLCKSLDLEIGEWFPMECCCCWRHWNVLWIPAAKCCGKSWINVST